jgi:Fe-S oxidoreductase
MKTETTNRKQISEPMISSFAEQLSEIIVRCTECGLCVDECAFLKKYGNPKEIATRYNPGNNKFGIMPYECSLCGLCSAVCPEGLDIRDMFIKMRREVALSCIAPFPGHNTLLKYEKIGMSRLFTFYALPKGCKEVLFPGCAFAGTRPGLTRKLFHLLEDMNPGLGIALDCCGRISDDLGLQGFTQTMLAELQDYLLSHGVEDVIVVCPNCYSMFREYAEGLNVKMVYEVLSDMPGLRALNNKTFVIHDPCSMRNNPDCQEMIRRLLSMVGISYKNTVHTGGKTLCCGNGAGVKSICPEFAEAWLDKLAIETSGSSVLTYCAGCAEMMGRRLKCAHVLDLLLAEKSLSSNLMSKHPFTFINRLLLKRYFRKTVNAGSVRERSYKTIIKQTLLRKV